MTEICHAERVALRKLIDLLPHLERIVQRDKDDEASLRPAQPAPHPTPTLVEAVEAVIKRFDQLSDPSNDDDGDPLYVHINKARQAVARERILAPLREKVIEAAMEEHGDPISRATHDCPICCALRNLKAAEEAAK